MAHRVTDGRVWCEGCREWWRDRTTFARHRPRCRRDVPLVEERTDLPRPAAGWHDQTLTERARP